MTDDPKVIKVPARKNEDWEMDKKAYVLVRLNKDDKSIQVRIMAIEEAHFQGKYVKKGQVFADYEGKNPEDLYYRILKDDWITNLQHAAYLGSELRKAYIALKSGKKYVQDKDLKF